MGSTERSEVPMPIWRIRTVWTGPPGAPFLSTHYFNSLLIVPQLAAEAVDAFWNDCSSHIDDAAVWQIENDVAEIAQDTGDVISVASIGSLGGSGLAGGEQMPAATQGLVRWRTGQYVGGREIRGRTFIPAPTESHGSSVPNTEYLQDIAGAAAGLVAMPEFVIWSKQNGLAPGVTAASVWNQWAVLRSRRD
jgi:hypothetical protein